MTAWVHDWVAYHASRRPDAPALTDIARGVTTSWGDLEFRVGRLAHLLRHHFGLQPGDRVAMIAENDTRIIELQFACMRSGLILVPMSWRLAIGEMITLARDAQPGSYSVTTRGMRRRRSLPTPPGSDCASAGPTRSPRATMIR